jgi:DNA-binding MarR family transcriptional regulator
MPDSSPPADVTPEALTALVESLMRTLHSRPPVSEGLAIMNESGLTVPQVVALHVLRLGGPRSVSEIADRIGLSRAATSHLVDRLVGMGMVDRAEDAEDRRQKRVSTTPAADVLIDRLMLSRMEGITTVFSMLRQETRVLMAVGLEQALADLGPADRGGTR